MLDYSVLEQFSILKFPIFFVVSSVDKIKTLFDYRHVFFVIVRDMRLGRFINIKYRRLSRVFKRWFKLAQSLLLPNLLSTKNYVYGRLVVLLLKSYFRLLIKKKILIFWRCNSQVFKIKLQLKLQQNIKSNFGGHYPFHSRLLNYYPGLLVIFFLILFHNFNGLLFYGFTNTAFLLQNFVISFQSVVGLTILGIYVRSFHFYKMFVPSGVPVLLLPFLVVIEIISHVAKIFSLAIRLFANMMSGHVLLHILTGFVVKLGKINLLFIVIPMIIIMAIVLLEYGITFLQAYVFITLLAIYFEEHFGFAQEDKVRMMKTVSINGQISYIFRRSYIWAIYNADSRWRKRDFFIYEFVEKRRYHRFKRWKRLWKLNFMENLYRGSKFKNRDNF